LPLPPPPLQPGDNPYCSSRSRSSYESNCSSSSRRRRRRSSSSSSNSSNRKINRVNPPSLPPPPPPVQPGENPAEFILETYSLSVSSSTELGSCRLAFTRYCFYSEAFVHESIIRVLPPPTCIARTIAILLQVDRAIYDAPPTPLFYAIHHTILVMTISCTCQAAGHLELMWVRTKTKQTLW